MKIEKGEILQGKVTGIAKFGAFVEIAPGKSGLVYISEIANTFVKEVSDHLTVGQEVTVKVVSIDEQAIPARRIPVTDREVAILATRKTRSIVSIAPTNANIQMLLIRSL